MVGLGGLPLIMGLQYATKVYARYVNTFTILFFTQLIRSEILFLTRSNYVSAISGIYIVYAPAIHYNIFVTENSERV